MTSGMDRFITLLSEARADRVRRLVENETAQELTLPGGKHTGDPTLKETRDALTAYQRRGAPASR